MSKNTEYFFEKIDGNKIKCIEKIVDENEVITKENIVLASIQLSYFKNQEEYLEDIINKSNLQLQKIKEYILILQGL